MSETIGGCYLIHFTSPLAHAQHYMGYSSDIAQRIERHRAGDGSHLTRAAVKAGIGLILARVWPGGTRTDERRMKGTKHYVKRFCPICNSARAYSATVRNAHEWRLAIENPGLLG